MLGSKRPQGLPAVELSSPRADAAPCARIRSRLRSFTLSFVNPARDRTRATSIRRYCYHHAPEPAREEDYDAVLRAAQRGLMLVTLDESLATSERAYADIWNAFHGRVTSLGPKTALLRSYAALALEHHESIALLIRNGLSGSALALARPVIEIMWHAGWANAFADDKQIEEILNGRFRFPPARAVVKALDEKYETGTFFQDVHSGAWNELDGYTHSGGRQPPARFTDMDIQPSYTEAEKIRVLTSSLAAAGMTVIVVLKAHGRMEDAARVEQTLLSTGARLADCRLVIGQP